MSTGITLQTLEEKLREMTTARVGIGRTGGGWTTKATLSFALDHARAREAVWSGMNLPALQSAFAKWPLSTVSSAAHDRATYVRRPDLGRVLAPGEDLSSLPKGKIVIVVADGLSATAVNKNAVSVVSGLQDLLSEPAPIVLVERGRVAIGDDIGAATEARAVVMLIGERPGLSSADSLGAYITWEPKPGLPDSRRNCISNIREGGLSPAYAAERIVLLLKQMEQMRISGVALDSNALTA